MCAQKRTGPVWHSRNHWQLAWWAGWIISYYDSWQAEAWRKVCSSKQLTHGAAGLLENLIKQQLLGKSKPQTMLHVSCLALVCCWSSCGLFLASQSILTFLKPSLDTLGAGAMPFFAFLGVLTPVSGWSSWFISIFAGSWLSICAAVFLSCIEKTVFMSAAYHYTAQTDSYICNNMPGYGMLEPAVGALWHMALIWHCHILLQTSTHNNTRAMKSVWGLPDPEAWRAASRTKGKRLWRQRTWKWIWPAARFVPDSQGQ